MSIRRAPRPTSNFYILDKSISEDQRLSWAARGVLVFLLGKPDNWVVSISALVNETSGAIKRTGRDGVYGIINELRTVGYLRREEARSEGGAFGGVEYSVCESPLPALPDTALPDTALPLPVNPTLTRTDEKQELKKKQELNEHALPEWLDGAAWDGYVAMRKQIKKPMTARAAELAIKSLGKLRNGGQDPNAVLDQSTMNCWQGLFEVKGGVVNTKMPQRMSAAAEQTLANGRALRERLFGGGQDAEE